MRISIDHRTCYRFSEPQARLVQLLRMTPQDSVSQTVVEWRIGVDCDARLREAQDGFGNRVTMLYATGPLDSIEISVTGEILTGEGHGIVGGAPEPLPPALFARAAPRALATPEIAAFAGGFAGSDMIERLHALNLALCDRFEGVVEDHDEGRTAGETFAGTRGTPRDLAHVFIAAAHSLAVPARYISGYRPSRVDHAPAPHAWAEAHVEGLGWIAFDPSRGICADETYARVAVGLDAATAAPVAGSRLGPGQEVLNVDVQVEARASEG